MLLCMREVLDLMITMISNEIIIPLISAFLSGGFIVVISQYLMHRKEIILKKVVHSRDISQNMSNKFRDFKNALNNYIKKKLKKDDARDEFVSLTNSAEDLFNSIQDICEAILDNSITKNGRKRYLPHIEEIITSNLIEKYYKAVGLEFKKSNYIIIQEVFDKYHT